MSAAPRLGGSIYADVHLDDGAPAELAAASDATFGTFDVYGELITYCGAVVSIGTHRLGIAVDCVMHAEAIGLNKTSNKVMAARAALTAFGVPPDGPTFIGHDNKAGVLVVNSAGSSARSRHFLRMYTIMQQRIACDSIAVGHIADAENPADFLTKWVDKAKFRRTNAYITGSRAT